MKAEHLAYPLHRFRPSPRALTRKRKLSAHAFLPAFAPVSASGPAFAGLRPPAGCGSRGPLVPRTLRPRSGGRSGGAERSAREGARLTARRGRSASRSCGVKEHLAGGRIAFARSGASRSVDAPRGAAGSLRRSAEGNAAAFSVMSEEERTLRAEAFVAALAEAEKGRYSPIRDGRTASRRPRLGGSSRCRCFGRASCGSRPHPRAAGRRCDGGPCLLI